MSEAHTVTGLLIGICEGNEAAIEKLVNLYLDRLVGVGRRTYQQRFTDVPRPAEDEEDAALSALDSFCQAAGEGKITDLANRHELWRLLVKITVRKIYDQRERATAQKRGGKESRSTAEALGQLISELPDPQIQAELNDTCRAALDALKDSDQKQIAELHLQGRSSPEIAETLGVTKRTIFRELKDIREHWDRRFADDQ